MADYEISSSHGSELIAALCGFDTYASLKAKLNEFQQSPAARIDTKKFEEKHAKLGYNQASGEFMRLSFNQLTLPDRPWLQHNTAQIYQRDSWFFHCQRNNIPYITIHKKKKYCYLEWDCISLDPKFEAHVRKKLGDQLGGLLFKLYQLVANGNDPKSYFNGAAFVGNISKLSESTARALANEYFLQLTPWKFE